MSETNQDISALLQELKEAGQQDSAGSFTIDPKKAREKFREFGLGELHEYTCVLVSALIAGGATFLDIEADSDDFIVSSDFFATHHELDHLFSLASGGSDDVQFFRLALGLQAALALEPQKVELQCWDGERGSRLELGAKQLSVESLATCPWEDEKVRSRLHVREKPGLRVVGRFVRKAIRDEATPEQELLRNRCGLSAVPITLNGELLNQDLSLGPCHAYLHFSPGGEGRERSISLPDVPHRHLQSEDFEAYVLFGDEPRDERAEVVLSGLTVPGWPLQYATKVLLFSDNLTTDLSLSHLVEDAKLESIQKRIRVAIIETLPEWLEGPLSAANSFPVKGGTPLTYRQLQASYEYFGFLTVVTPNYEGPAHNQAPLVKSGTPFLALLFPEQVKDEAIRGLLPPGQYRAKKRLPTGTEIGLTMEAQRDESEVHSDFDILSLSWLVSGSGDEPELQDILELYEQASIESICLTEILEILRFVTARSAPLRTIREVMNDSSTPFGLDPESFLSRLVTYHSLRNFGGEKISLEKIFSTSHTYWKQFTNNPLRFERPNKTTVLVPESQYSALVGVVGYMNMSNYSGIRSGLIDTKGRLVCEPEVMRRGKGVRCGRIEYHADDLVGFCDPDGVPEIKARYSRVSEFQDEFAVVQTDQGDSRLMNTDGELVGPRCDFISDLHDGLRLASQGERCGYLHNTGKIAIPFELKSGGHFGQGEALATRSGRRVFIDKAGKELRECYSEVEFMGPLTEGLRMSQVDGLWGFVDPDGSWVIRPQYSLAAPPSKGLIPAQRGELWGLIDIKGETVVPFQYQWMDLHFSEDLIAVGRLEDYGFLNRKGQEVLSGFEHCGAFNDGLAPARKNGKWGFIDHSGAFVIEPKFLSARSFSEGRAVVSVYNS